MHGLTADLCKDWVLKPGQPGPVKKHAGGHLQHLSCATLPFDTFVQSILPKQHLSSSKTIMLTCHSSSKTIISLSPWRGGAGGGGAAVSGSAVPPSRFSRAFSERPVRLPTRQRKKPSVEHTWRSLVKDTFMTDRNRMWFRCAF